MITISHLRHVEYTVFININTTTIKLTILVLNSNSCVFYVVNKNNYYCKAVVVCLNYQ